MNFRYRIMQFMSGRYGSDQLFYGLAISAAALSFINLFIRSIIIQAIVYAILFFAVFRMFSRNLEVRRKENQWFISKINLFKRKKE